MALHPLADRIVAKSVEAESTSPAGILLPEQSKEKTQVAKVLAVGKDVKEVKVGDNIIHSEYGPNRFKQGSEELLIVKEEDVLAVVKG
ncbi:MAG: groS [Patescibacteria group bacterium]|jgi:chaperonin GroES|nr:groS [Patescibacteria group bacterium]